MKGKAAVIKAESGAVVGVARNPEGEFRLSLFCEGKDCHVVLTRDEMAMVREQISFFLRSKP